MEVTGEQEVWSDTESMTLVYSTLVEETVDIYGFVLYLRHCEGS